MQPHALPILALAALALGACERTQPKVTEQSLQHLRDAFPGMTTECLDRIRLGGIEAMPNRTDQCFEMTKPQRWRGLWRNAFEGQRFCPEPAPKCEDDGQAGHIWIRFPDGGAPFGSRADGKAYRIEFIGRRTLMPGQHGHMGVSGHEVLVDKLISIAPVAD